MSAGKWATIATEARIEVARLRAELEVERRAADTLASWHKAIAERDLWADGLGDSEPDEREARMVEIAFGAMTAHNSRRAEEVFAAVAREGGAS